MLRRKIVSVVTCRVNFSNLYILPQCKIYFLQPFILLPQYNEQNIFIVNDVDFNYECFIKLLYVFIIKNIFIKLIYMYIYNLYTVSNLIKVNFFYPYSPLGFCENS